MTESGCLVPSPGWLEGGAWWVFMAPLPAWDPASANTRRPLLTTSIYRRTPIPTPWSLPPTAKSHEEHCNIWAP